MKRRHALHLMGFLAGATLGPSVLKSHSSG